MQRAKEVLAELGRWPTHVYLFKTSGNAEPDIVGSYLGRAIVCECKQFGEKPTRVQYIRLRQWAAAGAFACWTEDGYFFRRVFPVKGTPELEYSYDALKQNRDGIADGSL